MTRSARATVRGEPEERRHPSLAKMQTRIEALEAELQKAHTLCGASFGALMTYDGERFHSVAHQGTPAPFREFLASGILPKPGDPFGRMVEGAALSHIHDLSEVAACY